MKGKDIYTFIVVAIVSAAISVVISNVIISSDENRSESVTVVEPVSAELTRPPATYYNENSVNPTQIIRIGEGTSPQPFGSQ